MVWTFSAYLEALAVMPQLRILEDYKSTENIGGDFILLLG